MLGRRLCRRVPFDSPLEQWLISAALGVAALGHSLFLMGLAGLLRVVPVGLLFAGVHLASLQSWRELLQDLRRRSPASRRGTAIAVAGTVLLIPIVAPALYPPISFDSTLYHLPFARAFASTGGLPFVPSLRFPVFPQLMEVLFACMLLLSGDAGAQLLQALATALTAGLVFVWGRHVFGPAAAWIAAALCLGNPLVTYLAGTAYVDPGLALFATAALLAVQRWRRSGGVAWLALAAVFAASAAATKYLGLFFVAAVAAIVVGTRPLGRARDALGFAAVAAAILIPWYGRILAHTGNPVFPFATRLFGTSEWVSRHSEDLSMPLLSTLTLPWDLVFRRETLPWHAPLSPAYLVLLPFVVYTAARDARVREIVLVAVAYVVALRAVSDDPRYLLAVLPAWSVASGAALAILPGVRRSLVPVAGVLLLPGWLYAAWHIRRLGPLPLTSAARSEFLARRLPAYAAIRFLNETRGSDYTLYAFHAENLAYFAEGRFLGDWFGPASFAKVLDAGATPARLHAKLRALGVDYLLVVKGRAPPAHEDPGFERRFRRVYTDAKASVYALGAAGLTRAS